MALRTPKERNVRLNISKILAAAIVLGGCGGSTTVVNEPEQAEPTTVPAPPPGGETETEIETPDGEEKEIKVETEAD